MSQDQPTDINEEPQTECRRCGQLKRLMLGGVCLDCIKETLVERLPLLRRALEERYGPALDEWLDGGRIIGARWGVDPDLLISRERLEDFVRGVVKEAANKEGLGLILSGDDELWRPSRIGELLDWVCTRCREGIQELNESLEEAINSAPTAEAERELIEIVTGKRRVSKRYVREDALSAVVLTEGNPLSLATRVLIDLRYRADGGSSLYAEALEGEISSVWREIEADLPPDIVWLITTDEW